MKKSLLYIIFFCVLSNCIAVPKQLLDASEKQQKELEDIKKLYFTNMHNQLMSIEKYQLAILDIYENQYILEYSQSVSIKNDGVIIQESYNSPIGDPDIDFIVLSTYQKIRTFFDQKRDSVRYDIRNRKIEIEKAKENFENIEALNSAINSYLKSVVNMKESRDKLARQIRDNIMSVSRIPVNFNNFPEPKILVEELTFEF